MAASDVALPLRVGARTVWTLRRRLVRRALTLEEALAGAAPALPPLQPDEQGYFITALPTAALAELALAYPDLRLFVRQRYPRSYAGLRQSFDRWFGAFSAKSRSTLKRKARKLAERSGGALDVRCYRTPEEIDRFYREARRISERTYQERLLGAGLPEGREALAEMHALAAADRVRAWLLFVDGNPASYLYAPAEGLTLIYEYVGYDPDFAGYSPGTVLQLEAMRQLMDEGRFKLFDFTDGDGQHKRQFGTGSIDCADILLMRPTAANRLIGGVLNGFDAAVALAKKMVTAIGGSSAVKRLRR